MLIKFMGGRGGGGPIAAYLFDAHRAGREEAAPEVLRGDIARTRELIDGIDRRWTYTTGVISFAREDAPDEDQQRAVMDDFERVAFAGLDPEQYDITWVRHRHTEGGRVELHFLVPRMELTTGKALNIAPPGWERTYAPLRDAWNHAEGWARPEDPERARTVQQDRQAPERAQTREAVTAFLETRILAGEITDRAGIVAALEEAGFTVPRQGKDYVTAADPETGARFRLKGRIYERDWTRGAELDRAARREAEAGPRADRGVDRERAAAARRELEQVVDGRARRHGEQYARTHGADAERDGHDRAAAAALAAVDRLELRDGRGGVLRLAVDGDGLGALGAGVAHEGDGARRAHAGGLGGPDGRRGHPEGAGGDVRDRAGGHGARLDVRRERLPEAAGVSGDEPADGVRARALGRVRELGRRVREVGAGLGRHGRAAVASVAALLFRDQGAAREAERARDALGRCDASLGRADAAHHELSRAGEEARERAVALEREHTREVERARSYSRGYGSGLSL